MDQCREDNYADEEAVGIMGYAGFLPVYPSLPAAEISNKQNLIKIMTARSANRIRMYLALGSSFDATAAEQVSSTAR